MAVSRSDALLKARSIGGVPAARRSTAYANVGELLRSQVERYGDKVWLIFYPDQKDSGALPDARRTYTYNEFSGLAGRTANYLLSAGIRKGDRIATVSFNHPDAVIQYVAAFLIGAVVVPVNVGEDDRRIGYILQNSRCKLALVREEFFERLGRIIAGTPGIKTIVRVGSESTGGPEGNFHAQIARQPAAVPPDQQPDGNDEALLIYTSGTTGLPKGVVLTQENLLVDAQGIAEWHGMTPDQRMMCVLPLHHVNGIVVTIMTPLYYGGSVVLNQKFHTGKFFPRIAAEGVHVASVVPTLLQFLLHEHPDCPAEDLSRFRHLICGAGPLTTELAGRFEDRFKIPIVHGYGLSETTCYSCFLPVDLSPEAHRRWLTGCGFPSIGVPIPPNEMSIHDDRGNELAEEARGEIVIRGLNVMKGYDANAEANDAAFTHGWFRSGDEGFFRYDENGRKFFFITGRIKELIIRGGVNISPFEIDEVLMNVPGVKAGLAVGFDNDWYGEEVGAYVQPEERASLSEEDVIGYCRRFFPFPKCPKVVVFGNDIPVTSTGKYQRNRLKPLFERWKSEQFTERSESGT
ncbi:MAG TPA: class I adenylate-forming enzyme family protein [Bacteroidota bacterium]|nr:class I adenylate-forming enzyme family protein [Bacteroidota bacterium]